MSDAIAEQNGFPLDEDDFEESVAEMKGQIEAIIFDDKRKFRIEYFLRGFDSAYRIICSWFNEIRNFNSIYESIDKDTYLNIRYLLDAEIDNSTRQEYELLVLERAIPEVPTQIERSLYESLWFLKWCHDVFFELYEYDQYFQEGEYTVENRDKWFENWASYDRDELFVLCCEVHDYLYDSEDEEFRFFAQEFINKMDLANSFFVFMEERS